MKQNLNKCPEHNIYATEEERMCPNSLLIEHFELKHQGIIQNSNYE
jgi:hypothetical protein